MEAKKIPIGYRVSDNKTYYLPIPENTAEAKTNLFMLGKQGIGKSNLIMLAIYFMHKYYLESKGQYGCIPIVFAPTFEYAKLKQKSVKTGRYPPNTAPQGIQVLHYSFKLANIPDYLRGEMQIVKLEFCELTVEDIAVFCGLAGDNEALGKIEKYLEEIRKEFGNNYSVNHFLEIAKMEKGAPFNSLYYIFKSLKENGLFDHDCSTFDWETALKQRKPVCFHFGEIDDDSTMQAITGVLLRKLFALSNKYMNAVYKKTSLQNLGKKPDDYLSDDEKWFLQNFVIGLFFEEAHLFFPPTTTKVLKSFPAHKYFRLISMALGRKRNFKFNFLVSQRLELLYKEFRTEFDDLFTGSKVDATDKTALGELFRQILVSQADVRALVSMVCGNEKYEFTVVDLNALNAFVSKIQMGQTPPQGAEPITKFKAFLSPCGMY